MVITFQNLLIGWIVSVLVKQLGLDGNGGVGPETKTVLDGDGLEALRGQLREGSGGGIIFGR